MLCFSGTGYEWEGGLAEIPGQQPEDNLFMGLGRWVRGHWQGVVVGIIVVALLVSLAIGLYWWPESGFDKYEGKEDVERLKTLWDWLDLLLVPAVLAAGGLLFSRAERKNEREEANKRAALDRELAGNRAKEERERADDALRQALVQDYLDRMSDLLLDKEKKLASSAPEDLVRDVARARTLTVLHGLEKDGARKGYIVQFLYETGLIKGKEPVVELKGATLHEARLSNVTLIEANLIGANLIGADLSRANLSRANLSRANLSRANLSRANLIGANLIGANLIGADLRGAYLRGADLREAYLIGADLIGAYIRYAIVTYEQLNSAWSLEGATMPDGSKYTSVPPTTGMGPVPHADAAQDGQDSPTT
jgi:hypothetical protein